LKIAKLSILLLVAVALLAAPSCVLKVAKTSSREGRPLPVREFPPTEDPSAVIWKGVLRNALGPTLYLVKTPAGCVYVISDVSAAGVATTDCPPPEVSQ
jgi:hypothetical protein